MSTACFALARHSLFQHPKGVDWPHVVLAAGTASQCTVHVLCLNLLNLCAAFDRVLQSVLA